MTSKTKAILIFFVIVIIGLFWFNYETLKLNFIIFLIVSRGIIAPNRFWWGISDMLLKDANGIDFYRSLQKKYRQEKIIPLNFAVQPMNLVVDNNFIKQILDQSPEVFGVGKLKYNFFSSFMSKNVGVSEGKEWEHRRLINEEVLDTDKLHRFSEIWYTYLRNIINTGKLPQNFNDFSQLAKKITTNMVFGKTTGHSSVYNIFSEANTIQALFKMDLTNSQVKRFYEDFLKKNIQNPQNWSLMKLMVENEPNKEEILHQIPHFMFPLLGQIAITTPRVLLLLISHPRVMQKLLTELRNPCLNLKSINDIFKLPYLRYIILETLRLNNPVTTTFRTLLRDYKFSPDPQYWYPKGSQFVILNNPVLRDPAFWDKPNQFIPERWEQSGLEYSYYSLMFNQGPQRCPGKELSIMAIESTLVQILLKSGLIQNPQKLNKIRAYPPIDPKNIPQMINPFKIKFSFC